MGGMRNKSIFCRYELTFSKNLIGFNRKDRLLAVYSGVCFMNISCSTTINYPRTLSLIVPLNKKNMVPYSLNQNFHQSHYLLTVQIVGYCVVHLVHLMSTSDGQDLEMTGCEYYGHLMYWMLQAYMLNHFF